MHLSTLRLSKGTSGLNGTIDQMDLTYLHNTPSKCCRICLLSNPMNVLECSLKLMVYLRHKAGPNNSRKAEMIPCIPFVWSQRDKAIN